MGKVLSKEQCCEISVGQNVPQTRAIVMYKCNPHKCVLALTEITDLPLMMALSSLQKDRAMFVQASFRVSIYFFRDDAVM